MDNIHTVQYIDGKTLMEKIVTPAEFIIEDFLGKGLHILAGAPKVGKSWMVLWFCLQIAKGEPIWGMPVKQGEVLYLALEDHENRLQDRIILLGDDAPENLHFSFSYPLLGNGLEEEIEKFLHAYPHTVLVVIDTLQMIRSNVFEYGYAADYKDMVGLKELTKKYQIAILLVHHLRKDETGDVFQRISGTVGIQGAADSCFTLVEDKRGSGKALLSCIGRDIAYREISLRRTENQIWELTEDSIEEKEKDLLPEKITQLMEGRLFFEAPPTEFAELLRDSYYVNVLPQTLLKRLDQNRYELKKLGFSFQSRKSNGTRYIKVFRIEEETGTVGTVEIGTQASEK